MITNRILLFLAAFTLLSQGSFVIAQPVKTEVTKATTPFDDSKLNSDSIPNVIPVKGEFEQIIILRFKYNSDLLQGLEEMADEHGIRNGVILSGIGSMRNYHIHYVSNNEFPSKNIYVKDRDAPSDLVSINGYIIDGRVHAHVTLANEEGAFGGHLEYGTTVFTFAIVTIGILEDELDLKWIDDKNYR